MGRGGTLPERNGQSAIFGAVQWGWPRVVQYLIDHGAEVGCRGRPPACRRSTRLSGRAGSADNHPSPEVAKIIQAAISR